MCGRYTHKFTWEEIHDLLAKGKWPARLALPSQADFLAPRYNVTPSQVAPVIRALPPATGATPELGVSLLRWGLAPHWMKNLNDGESIARGETVATKPTYRAAFAARRCLVPASGFFEWMKSKTPGLFPGAEVIAGPSRPFYITRADSAPLLLAGIWERWGSGQTCVETFAIITTEPNAEMARVHDRMPVILEPEAVRNWLNLHATASELGAMLRPAADGLLQMHEMSRQINDPKAQGASLIDPLG